MGLPEGSELAFKSGKTTNVGYIKANKLIFTSTIELAVVSSNGKITKLPDQLLSLI